MNGPAASNPADEKRPSATPQMTRDWIARGFTAVEDVVYIGLGLLLGAIAIVLLVNGIISFVQNLASGNFTSSAIELLDQILLILLIVELLYTVQVSFRTHSLLPEPFLLVGLIAAIRRVLVLTAEFSRIPAHTEEMFKHFILELAILTALILAVTISFVLVRGRSENAAPRG